MQRKLNLQKIVDELKQDEGYRRHPYFDTLGNKTIAHGRNLDVKGINELEAQMLLENDILECHEKLVLFDWYIEQPQVVKQALINMCFNLGLRGLLSFKKMIDALTKKNYKLAANEALDSKWANQVGDRANRVANKIRQGNEI